MMRTALVIGALLVSAGAVMAQQDVAVTQQNLMKSQGRSMYGVLGKMIKGETPYDQAAIDKALSDLQTDVAKIATVFTPNPKEDVVNANFGASQKIWQNKADFDGRFSGGHQGDRGHQRQDQGRRDAEGRLRCHSGKVHRLPRHLSRQVEVSLPDGTARRRKFQIAANFKSRRGEGRPAFTPWSFRTPRCCQRTTSPALTS